MVISFTIPGDPVPQGRPRAGKRNGKVVMYDPAESKNYKRHVSLIARQHAPKLLLDGPLIMKVDVHRSMPKSQSKKWKQKAVSGEIRPTTKPDNSNYVKGIEDALNGIIYKDDSQIVDLHVSKYYSDDPRVEIRIYEEGFCEIKTYEFYE